ncbi:uncharacterized protein DNG_09301 [Cephalotrichum gorgonifer]|uniref:Uncharacterized protein n=1 Tax=Cephalotrichum gorgonifer TaxID=2041049 RepID=A0AAE8N5E9_9PEZI|nr:uncharacterized protein DNG_09301 [Cephalotrichum gorgonifer]
MTTITRGLTRGLPRPATAYLARGFTTTAPAKTGLKDTIKTVDRKVSDTLVGSINIGASVAHKLRLAGETVVHGKEGADRVRREGSWEGKGGTKPHEPRQKLKVGEGSQPPWTGSDF